MTGAPDPGAFAAALPVCDLIGVDTLSAAPGVLARCLLCGHRCAADTAAQATRAAASHLITGHGAMIGIR